MVFVRPTGQRRWLKSPHGWKVTQSAPAAGRHVTSRCWMAPSWRRSRKQWKDPRCLRWLHIPSARQRHESTVRALTESVSLFPSDEEGHQESPCDSEASSPLQGLYRLFYCVETHVVMCGQRYYRVCLCAAPGAAAGRGCRPQRRVSSVWQSRQHQREFHCPAGTQRDNHWHQRRWEVSVIIIILK